MRKTGVCWDENDKSPSIGQEILDTPSSERECLDLCLEFQEENPTFDITGCEYVNYPNVTYGPRGCNVYETTKIVDGSKRDANAVCWIFAFGKP